MCRHGVGVVERTTGPVKTVNLVQQLVVFDVMRIGVFACEQEVAARVEVAHRLELIQKETATMLKDLLLNAMELAKLNSYLIAPPWVH